MSFTRSLNSNIRRRVKSVYFTALRIKWNFKKSHAGGIHVTAHILCVKNRAYVSVAIVACESFLYWNPGSTIIVHCDSSTLDELSKKFRRLVRARKVQIVSEVPNNVTWQQAKIEIICSLSGTSEIYMDADLRWNGPCPALQEPVFYVREFELSSREEFSGIYTQLLRNKWPMALMSNTSFVYLDRHQISKRSILDIQEIYSLLSTWLIDETPVSAVTAQIHRLSEQIAVSVVLNDALRMGHLKQTDERADGQFVETSYFGATGLGF